MVGWFVHVLTLSWWIDSVMVLKTGQQQGHSRVGSVSQRLGFRLRPGREASAWHPYLIPALLQIFTQRRKNLQIELHVLRKRNNNSCCARAWSYVCVVKMLVLGPSAKDPVFIASTERSLIPFRTWFLVVFKMTNVFCPTGVELILLIPIAYKINPYRG